MLATKVTSPILKASVPFLPATNSPITAPINSPIIIPNGGKKNNPTSIPMIEPHIPYLEAL